MGCQIDWKWNKKWKNWLKGCPKNVGNELFWIWPMSKSQTPLKPCKSVSSKSRFIKFHCQWLLVPMGLNLPISYVNFAYSLQQCPEANNSNKKSALKVIKVMSWEHHYAIHIHSFYDKCIRDCKNLICFQSYGTVPFVPDIEFIVEGPIILEFQNCQRRLNLFVK